MQKLLLAGLAASALSLAAFTPAQAEGGLRSVRPSRLVRPLPAKHGYGFGGGYGWHRPGGYGYGYGLAPPLALRLRPSLGLSPPLGLSSASRL